MENWVGRGCFGADRYGLLSFLVALFCMQYDENISAQHKLRYSPPHVFIFEEHILIILVNTLTQCLP
jgi:hypothetical protein